MYSAVRNANEGGTDRRVRPRRADHGLAAPRSASTTRQTLQEWALHFTPLIIACNYFYGSLHFIVTIGVGIYLFRKWSDDYPRWRNTLGIATALALIGFRFWPLMPPRARSPAHFGFVDTLAKYPTFWSFNSGAVSKISNQFAAMPSVHCCLGAVVRVRARAAAEARAGPSASPASTR